MRLASARVIRTVFLSLAILSCATEQAVGPTLTAPAGASLVGEAPTPAKVVISQVYGAGGNSGATLNHDYIELFNAGGTEQSLDGWSVQYASATGTGNFGVTNQITPLSGSIAPGQYVLVEEAGGTAGAPVVGDIRLVPGFNAISMAAGAGKVALVRSATSLGCNGSNSACSAAALALIVDLVGYGNANFFEGSGGAPTIGTTTADFRRDHGCTDTDNNGADFTAVNPPAPRTRATLVNPCVPIVPVGPVVTVTITPEDASVRVGGTLQLTATGKDDADNVSPTTFSWVSSDPSIATVNPTTGLATGVKEGTVDVTATSANGVPATTSLSVAEAGSVASVTIAINTPRQAPVGYTKPAFPTVKLDDGTNVTATTTLTWTSSNSAVATVDALGYISAIAPGSVTIRATAPNGVFGGNSFTVIPATAPTTAIYRNHLEFGTPIDNTPGDELILSKPQYVESYNRNRGGPNWVSWDLNASQFGPVPRCDCFTADQTLPPDVYHVVDFDYRNGGYDRGHMVQSESRTTTDQENAATFLLTNILPQANANNTGPWSKFENHLNDQARATNGVTTPHEVYVVAGGIYSATPGTLKNEGKVAIPDYTWKVAVIMPAGKGLADVHSVSDLQIEAVKMPNLVGGTGPASVVGIHSDWESYRTTVHELEAETGYDLLSALPDAIECKVESRDCGPTAELDGPASGVEGADLTFDGSGSADPDGDAVIYAWSFGDGGTSSAASPSHTFADNGVYTVTLTVKDPSGLEDTKSKTVTISNVAPVVKTLTVSSSVLSGETVNALATFGDAGVNDAPWSYVFDWGAGNTANGVTSSQGSSVGSNRSFFEAGTYTVSFIVQDKDGAASLIRTATFTVGRIPLELSANPNRINIGGDGNGQVIVTVYGTRDVDASAIDLSSVSIGSVTPDENGSGDAKASVADANGDGLADLVLHFQRSALLGAGQLRNSTTQLVLRANLTDHRQIEARGSVNVIGAMK